MDAIAQISGVPLSLEVFEDLAAFASSELGIKMPPSKLPMLRSRLQRRLRQLGIDCMEEYRDYLLSTEPDSHERREFLDCVTTNKTDFFREPLHFEFLTNTALPDLDPGCLRPWNPKVWCAGCSSGEEAYTLAMVLNEYGESRGLFNYSILATDICTAVLDEGETAIYSTADIEPVAPLQRRRYFLRSRIPGQNVVRVVPELRSRVHFHRLNFMDDVYPLADQFDVIFFRNVAIYFDRQTQEAVINKLCRHLRPGGYLFIGHSESLQGLDVPVRVISPAVYCKDR